MGSTAWVWMWVHIHHSRLPPGSYLPSYVLATYGAHQRQAAAACTDSLPAVPAPSAVRSPRPLGPALEPRAQTVGGPKFGSQRKEGRDPPSPRAAAGASPVSPAAPWRRVQAWGRARGRRRSPPAGRAQRAASSSRSRSRRAGSAAVRTTWFAILCCPNSVCSGSLCACRPCAPAAPGMRRGHRSAGSPSAWCSEASETPRAYIFSARPRRPPVRARRLSLALARPSPLPPDDCTPGSGSWPRLLKPRWTALRRRRARGPGDAVLPSPGARETEGAVSCSLARGRWSHVTRIPRRARSSSADRDTRTQPARRGAAQAAPWRRLPLLDPHARAQTNSARPRALVSSPLEVLSKSDQFSFNPVAPQRFAVGEGRGVPSLRPIAAHCRPGVKSQLSFSPSKAPSWDFIFLTRGGWRSVSGGVGINECSVLSFA